MSKALLAVEQMESLIAHVRGHKVMFDADLAALYQVETFRLNEAVKRKIGFLRDDEA